MERIIASDWILPVASPPVKNGIISARDNVIKKIADEAAFRNENRSLSLDIKNYPGYVILPAFVNAHTHLFFNSFNNKTVSRKKFSEWVGEIVEYRNRISTEEIESAIITSAEKMYKGGVSLIGNICSDFFGDGEIVEKTALRGVNYLEIAGFAFEMKERLGIAMGRLNEKNVQDGKFKYIPSPHSIYSCESVLIRKIKALSEETGLPFSIHLAESIEESEFTVNNSGGLKDFLIKRGIPHGFIETYGLSPVKYLNSIGGLCHGMVAVHCVHIDDVDIDILAENGVRIVTCPGSNQFLDNGIALLEKFMEKGISISIGTDSAASNDKLDIFKEMQIIKEEHPLIPSSEIIKMATINGAKTLDFDDRYGTIEAGKIAELIALPLPENSVSWNAGQVEDYIVKECSGDNVIRINL